MSIRDRLSRQRGHCHRHAADQPRRVRRVPHHPLHRDSPVLCPVCGRRHRWTPSSSDGRVRALLHVRLHRRRGRRRAGPSPPPLPADWPICTRCSMWPPPPACPSRWPCVNRALTGPININNDHSDSMGARDAGWIQIYAENNQEAYDNYLQAMRIAETPDVRLPDHDLPGRLHHLPRGGEYSAGGGRGVSRPSWGNIIRSTICSNTENPAGRRPLRHLAPIIWSTRCSRPRP